MKRLDISVCDNCGAMTYMSFDAEGNAKKWKCVTGDHEYKPTGREWKIRPRQVGFDESDLYDSMIKSRSKYA